MRQDDTQLRHAFALADGSWLSWGYEDSRQEKQANFDVQLLPAAKVAISELGDLHSRDAYLVARAPLTDRLRGELDVFEQRTRSGQRAETRVNGGLFGTPTSKPREFSETNWRGGVQWQFGPRSSITGAAQKWRRPASVGSLAPIDTLGIAVNDRLTTNGGLYSQAIEGPQDMQIRQVFDDIKARLSTQIVPKTWPEFLEVLGLQKQPWSLCLDEFPYLTAVDPSLPSQWQRRRTSR